MAVDPKDTPPAVRNLIQTVTRCFYDTRQIIVIDALLKHLALRDDELGLMLNGSGGKNNKEVHKICGKLREDRLLNHVTRPEIKEGQQRPINRNYYYIDLRPTIDAIKWRVYKLVKAVEATTRNDYDTNGYICPQCKKRFGPLEVVSLWGPDMLNFICDNCGAVLTEDTESAESKASHERMNRLMAQLKRIRDALRLVDEINVPESDFESLLERRLVPFPSTTSATDTVSLPASQAVPKTVTGATSTTTAATFTIDYSVDGGLSAANKEEEEKRRAAAVANALPEWHSKSTVSGDLTYAGKPAAADVSYVAGTAAAGAVPAAGTEEKKADIKEVEANDEIAAFYAALAADREKTAAAAAAEEAEDEDEDEDGFEDVPMATLSAAPVPTTTDVIRPPKTDSDDSDDDDDAFEDV
ncbi:hypothetical protein G7K_3716-t1 [Saitoella complicata NRRL Y-17804]|uniref:HTH TFE/IIEalpha-type domain-containing protein n=1 Tax=Saitoella complicata (strain BCRC 22490 / CBS 7301 / JCM 7358 / NBRC 10748 / NRRL Y-17804) TaxID=698492 RepID=A0A0E9NI68_SAICN|nr:hypothetical protein G7K_3716-t1 [Saitoella complicata NRRL Y-17804]